ncbi:MAG: hypothetical protein FWH12_02335 [Treponema sp.]|nr:hypothetical protein [Treponema sp.]
MNHRISIRDIMVDNLDDLFKGEKAEAMYCDPPWGIGHIKYFRTLNGQKHKQSDDWLTFLGRIKFLYNRHVTGPLFLECGPRFVNDILQVFGTPSAKYECKYGAGLPFFVLCFGAVPANSPVAFKDWKIPYTVLGSIQNKPKSVFDCCVGLGQTARACKEIGAICYANELNPQRAEKTMKILDFEQV